MRCQERLSLVMFPFCRWSCFFSLSALALKPGCVHSGTGYTPYKQNQQLEQHGALLVLCFGVHAEDLHCSHGRAVCNLHEVQQLARVLLGKLDLLAHLRQPRKNSFGNPLRHRSRTGSYEKLRKFNRGTSFSGEPSITLRVHVLNTWVLGVLVIIVVFVVEVWGEYMIIRYLDP